MRTDAELARSILACATQVEITVDGAPLPHDDTPIGLQDWSGTPTFVCPPASALARAGQAGSEVSLSITSALGEDDSLLLAGRLRYAVAHPCACCDTQRALVPVAVDRVVLVRPGACMPIAVRSFSDPSLQLNPGYLRRTRLHLNAAHDAHLRAATARLANRPLRSIAGARVSRLEPTGVELQWVAEDGAHATPLAFVRPARDADELGAFLRRALHPELC